MDQTAPIANRLPADAQGVSPQDTTKPSGLDLIQVSRPEQAKPSHDPMTLVKFLSALDRPPPSQPGQLSARASGQVSHRESFIIPLNHQYLDKTAEIKSLEANNPSYTVSTAADGTRTLSNMQGVALSLKAFGLDEKLAVNSITIKKDESGNTTFGLQLENPLPRQTQKVFNAQPLLPLTFTLSDSGKLSLPKDSELFYSLSQQTGSTLPGMVLQDALNDAGSVAKFIETNPTWVNTIMAPIMDRYAKELTANLNASAPAAPVDTSQKVIGKIVQSGAAQPVLPPGAPAQPGTPTSPAKAPAKVPMTKITGPGDYHETMQIDGRERTFTIHVPQGYDPKKPMPVMILNHGLSQTGQLIEEQFNANKVSDRDGFIAIYPDSVNWFDVKDLRTWDSGNGLVLPGQHSGDIQFMDNIINTAKAQLNVDDRRVFMVGHSNGGMMTYAAAPALSGELAGIGILSSTMSGHEPQPKEPLTLFNAHGTADSIIPYEGITDTPPVLRDVGVPVFQPATFGTDYYKKLDGITEPYTVTRNGKQTIITAANPANGTAVEQVTIDGADHVWGDSEQVLEQAWNFLKDHPRQKAPNAKDDVIKEPDVPVGNLTTVQQLWGDVKKRGTLGIEQDFDNIFDAARPVSDGTISPSHLFDTINKSTHVPFNDPISSFLQNTTSISKKQDSIEIDRKTAANIPLDVGFGIGDLKSMTIDNIKFDMANANGYPELKNISGITLHAQVAGHDLSSQIQDITEIPDGPNGANGRIYRATMQNPLPSWVRTVLFSPDQFNVDLKLDNQTMTPTVINQAITERQLLGKNPWVNGIADEAQDVANIANHLTLGNTARVGSDLAITGGATYLAYRLALRFGGTKAKIAAGAAFIAAPMAIDFIRKELAP
jgi:polyhydroxybutyrate depolymerase